MKKPNETKKQVSWLFLILAAVSITAMLISNTISNRQLAFFDWNTPAGVLVFPVTYVLSDIFSEVYGYKASRKIALLTFAMNLFMVIIYTLTNLIPAPVWYENAEAFNIVLGGAPRIMLAGFISYQMGDWVNDLVFKRMKNKNRSKTKELHRGFGLRAIASSFIGEVVDSFVFIPVAFLGVLPFESLFGMIIIQVTIKTGYEILILPITSILVRKVSKYEGGVVDDSTATSSILG